MCLNGAWDFAIDGPNVITDRSDGKGFDRTILVPFAPESKLSGIGKTDFMTSVWYARDVEVPVDWSGHRVLVHFGAIDWQARVFANGTQIALHRGGSTLFSVDLTDHLQDGKCRLVVHAEDHLQSGMQPGGKQSLKEHSWGCFYTRTTGIWQSVWLEAAGDSYLRDMAILTDAGGQIVVTPEVRAMDENLTFRVTASLDGRVMATGARALRSGHALTLAVPDPVVWEPGQPVLYDLTFEVLRGDEVIDAVHSYCGLRDICIAGDRILLNGEEIYHRFVLDQGFYPDGIWTAPSDDALRRDIELAMAAGFNGARLHQKVFEPRFHYWADRLGYLTWAESPSWGADPEIEEANGNLLEEWVRIVRQCRNHPSIVAWTPSNETGGDKGRAEPIEEPHLRLIERLAAVTRAIDPSRPVNDASGWVHRDTDIWTVHSYVQDPEELHVQLAPYPGVYRDAPQSEPNYGGQPYILDEFGGAAFDLDGANTEFATNFNGGGEEFARPDTEKDKRDDGAAWGYGVPPASLDEFEARIRAQVKSVNAVSHIRGWCCTQLTDVEQEQNGLFTYDRRPKLPLSTYAEIFSEEPARVGKKLAGSR